MTWTKKHDEFAISCKLRPSARLLLCWILRRAKLNEIFELEIDLSVFNDWIAKVRGTPYDRKTIREAINQLDECTNGLVLISKRYSAWVMKLVVRPLSLVAGKNSPKLGNSPKLTTQNPMFSAEHKKRVIQQQQQDISKLDNLLQKIGLKYDQNALKRIWRLSGKSMADIVGAIKLLLHRHSTQAEPIGNPHGFIISCLRECWQKGFDLDYEPELPRFRTKSELAAFASRLRDSVKAKFGGDTVYESLSNRRRMLAQT